MMAADDSCDLEIPIWVKGTQKWVTGLTKRTTCDDVIYALLYQDGLQDSHHTSAYAVFEKWREVERPLQGRTKIVKIWRSWGAEQSNIHLVMRRIDEMEYSGEFSLTRRKKRYRHKSRDRERHHRDHEHRHHGYCRNTGERLRSMEKSVKLVISQERKLKDVIERVSDTDKLIEKYESLEHAKRVKQSGEDYVQDAYMESLSDDSMEEWFQTADAETIEQYIQLCDNLIALEEKFVNEQSKMEDLASQIQCHIKDVTSDKTQEASDAAIVSVLQVELNRAVSCAIMQQYKFQDLQRDLQFYDKKKQKNEQTIQRLQLELSELESEERDVSARTTLASEGSSSSGHSSGSGDSPGYKNPLPLPERTVAGKPPIPERVNPIPVPERTRNRSGSRNRNPPETGKQTPRNGIIERDNSSIPERKPILKQQRQPPDYQNGYIISTTRPTVTSESKVRFKTESLVDKYFWEETSSLSEGISVDHSDSDYKDNFENVPRRDVHTWVRTPYQTVKVEENDSNSDTGLSSMHSDDSGVFHLETLV